MKYLKYLLLSLVLLAIPYPNTMGVDFRSFALNVYEQECNTFVKPQDILEIEQDVAYEDYATYILYLRNEGRVVVTIEEENGREVFWKDEVYCGKYR